MKILNQRDVNSLLKNHPPHPTETRFHSCGDGLTIKVRSEKDGGSYRFFGKMNHPITKKRKPVTVGRPEEMTLLEARNKWEEIKLKAKELKCSPTRIDNFIQRKTLKDAIKIMMDGKKGKVTDNYWNECQRRFNTLILPNLDDMPIKNYETEGGVDLLEQMFLKIRGEDHLELERKCRGLCKEAFAIAQTRMWIKVNPVITNRNCLPTQTPKHYPMLKWNEVPDLIRKIECNAHKFAPQTVLCAKFMLLTGLRRGAAPRLRWDAIKPDGTILIDGKTEGLKRKTGVSDHIPHLIPITEDIEKLIEKAKFYSLSEEYVFSPITHSRYQHLDPDAVPNFIRSLGVINSNKEQFTIHGWRRTFLSSGQEVIKAPKEIIRKQMGHLPKGKVERTYNWAEFRPERKDFLTKWGKELTKMGMTI